MTDMSKDQPTDTRTDPRHNQRIVMPATGSEITCKSWLAEAPMRMLMNNLHTDLPENLHELVVYGGIGRAARTWNHFNEPDKKNLAMYGQMTAGSWICIDSQGIIQNTLETFVDLSDLA